MPPSTACTPARNPASKAWIKGMFTPPMKPTLPVWLFRAAATPTRNEPCSSAKINPATFGTSTTESTIAKLVSGNSDATFAIGSPNRNPTPITRSAPSDACNANNSSRLVPSSLAEASENSIPNSVAARSRPAAAASLND